MTPSVYDSKVRKIEHLKDCSRKECIVINQTHWYHASKWTVETAMADYLRKLGVIRLDNKTRQEVKA